MEGITPPRIKTFWTGLRDQGGHMFYGLCLMVGFVFPVPAWGASILVMIVATERELEQHQWDITKVGQTDLFFWFLACLIFNAVYYGIKYL